MVLKNRPHIRTPHFKTPLISVKDEEYYCTTGIDSDIRKATRAALRHMIEFLGAEYQLDRVAAYMLCSVSGDLRMHEVVRCHTRNSVETFDFLHFQVDMPNYVVSPLFGLFILMNSHVLCCVDWHDVTKVGTFKCGVKGIYFRKTVLSFPQSIELYLSICE